MSGGWCGRHYQIPLSPPPHPETPVCSCWTKKFPGLALLIELGCRAEPGVLRESGNRVGVAAPRFWEIPVRPGSAASTLVQRPAGPGPSPRLASPLLGALGQQTSPVPHLPGSAVSKEPVSSQRVGAQRSGKSSVGRETGSFLPHGPSPEGLGQSLGRAAGCKASSGSRSFPGGGSFWSRRTGWEGGSGHGERRESCRHGGVSLRKHTGCGEGVMPFRCHSEVQGRCFAHAAG